MKHTNEIQVKEQARAWRFYGILSEAFPVTSAPPKLLQMGHLGPGHLMLCHVAPTYTNFVKNEIIGPESPSC